MHRLALPVVVLLSACSSPKLPGEAVPAYVVQISNGFTGRGGVVIASEWVVGSAAAVPSSGEAQVTHAGKSYTLALVKRGEGGLGLFRLAGAKLDPAPLGDSGVLARGATVTIASFGEDGTPSPHAATVTGRRAHEGKAYVEIDGELAKGADGGGVFGPDGHLVGVLAFTLAPKLTYVLPIEYLTAVDGALAAAAVGKVKVSAAFEAQRAGAVGHPEPLRRPLAFDQLQVEQSFSRTALVGRITLLDEPGGKAAHASPLRYRLEAVDAQKARRILSEGAIAGADQRWEALVAKKAELAAATTAQFGAEYVTAHIAPYELGEVRYRLPFTVFCKQVTDSEVHALTLILADGRKTNEIAFADLVNVCAAIEDGDGTALEKAWGLGVAAGPVAKAPKPGKKHRR
jgi:hypothetical protein